MKPDLVSLALWSTGDLAELLLRAREMKSGAFDPGTPLARSAIALIFERESLRTRVSFEVGIAQLGGHPIVLQQETIGMATRESVYDIGRVLSTYCTLIIARTTKHQTCIQLAEGARVPVINALTDLVHPCQALADAMTLQEVGRFSPDARIVYLGDGSVMANSLLELAQKFPMNLTISCPPGFEPHPQLLADATAAQMSTITLLPDPREAVKGAHVLYADVWPRTEIDGGRRSTTFKPYQINKDLLRLAGRECLVMHRLPANRGEEITSDILDGKKSIVLRQAENRLHVQKAVMMSLTRR